MEENPMAEKSKKQILSSVLKWAQVILNGGEQAEASDPQLKKMKIEDVPVDDLRREKISLEQEERKLLARLKDIEKQKRLVFDDGVQAAGVREQRVNARRYKELDDEASNMDKMLQIISQQMRVLNGLVQLKERSRMAAESGLNSIIKDMDLHDLTVYITKASVDGEFNMDKLSQILGHLGEADGLSPEYREDQDVIDIMHAMQQAREATDASPESHESIIQDLNKSIEARKQAAESGEEEF
jgi:hypothetical protein